jgi:hypothetical protein
VQRRRYDFQFPIDRTIRISISRCWFCGATAKTLMMTTDMSRKIEPMHATLREVQSSNNVTGSSHMAELGDEIDWFLAAHRWKEATRGLAA